jgi:hypothetical protein
VESIEGTVSVAIQRRRLHDVRVAIPDRPVGERVDLFEDRRRVDLVLVDQTDQVAQLVGLPECDPTRREHGLDLLLHRLLGERADPRAVVAWRGGRRQRPPAHRSPCML